MKKIFFKIIILSLVLLFGLALYSGDIFAQSPPTVNVNQGLSGSPGSSFSIQRVYGILVGFACWLTRIALVLIVIMIVFYGILMLASQANPTAYSSAKTSLLYAVVGTLVIIGVYSIIATVVEFVDPGQVYITGFNRFLPISCSVNTSGGQLPIQN